MASAVLHKNKCNEFKWNLHSSNATCTGLNRRKKVIKIPTKYQLEKNGFAKLEALILKPKSRQSVCQVSYIMKQKCEVYWKRYSLILFGFMFNTCTNTEK